MKPAKIVLMLLILFNCFSVMNCLASETGAGIIRGKIVDERTGLPIPSADVTLLIPTGSTKTADVASDHDGRFEFSRIPFGKYRLIISREEYQTAEVENILVSEADKNVNLKKLQLRENVVMLDAITVTHERLKGEEQIDKTVFTINDDIRKASSSGLDMLRHIPSVTVDLMENVTLEGRSDIQFYVDGVKRSKDFVAQLSPEMIDRVELITNPSVKYDPDISGVISIMLKKKYRTGVNGSVTIPLPHPDKVVADPEVTIDYGDENMRLFAGDRLHHEKFDGTEKSVSIWDGPGGDSQQFEKESAGSLSYLENYLNYGADWFINDRTALNFLGEWRLSEFVPGGDLAENRLFQNDSLVQYFASDVTSEERNENYYFSLFFRHELEREGSELKLEAYYNNESDETDLTNIDTYYDIQDLSSVSSIISRKESIDDTRKTFQIRADFEFLLKDVKNEVGLRSYSGWTDSNSSRVITWQEGAYVGHFTYTEQRQQAYYNASGELSGVKWQLGLSGEYDHTDFDRAPDLDHFFLLPQASLQRNFGESGNLKLSYKRKIKRPEANQLHPFETVIDPLHIEKGNPDLEAEEENLVELSYSKKFGNNFISPKLYAKYTDNAIQDVTTITDGGVSETTKKNIGKNMEYGIGINTALQITNHWRLNGYLSVYNSEISSNGIVGDGLKQQKTACRLNATNIYTFPRDYSLFVITQYSSPTITYRRERQRDFLVILGMGKQFSKKAEINIIYVPFLTDFIYSKTITRYPGYYMETTGDIDVQNLFVIEFKHNFGQGKEIKKVERSVEYEKSQGDRAL